MTASPGAEALLADLIRRGLGAAEIFEKSGRSRCFARETATSDVSLAARTTQAMATEAGWAVRAGDRRRSLFFAATGSADPGALLPEPSPHSLRLPEAPILSAGLSEEPWSTPADFAVPLATESVAATLLQAIERELRRELPESRLLSAWLEDGASESTLVATSGLRAAWSARAAFLRLEVEDRGRRCRFEGAEREARQFEPRALALRLVDRLCALEATVGRAPVAYDAAVPLLLAAPLAARLVQAVAPLFLGPAANERILAFGALSPELTLVDDGRHPGGVLVAPVDGEGMPCGRAVLVEEGRFVRPLLTWWEAGSMPVAGCARRASWRDLPRRAPTHLFVAPSTTAVADLVAAGGAGAYLLDAEGPVRIDPLSLAFEVAVSALHLAAGRAVSPLGPVRLCGDLKGLLTGIRARARDLHFVPGDGMFGAPSLLVVLNVGEAEVATANPKDFAIDIAKNPAIVVSAPIEEE
ncbi:MAG: metallopeptidase TldD-related protein, partial [Thermoanaerobaculia bacterium]